MPDASPRSVTGSADGSPPAAVAAAREPPGQPVVRQQHPVHPRGVPGSFSASQRSLVTVNDIVGTDPVRAAHSARRRIP